VGFQWSDLLAGLSLYLVIEGLLAFVNPAGLKRVLSRIITLTDSNLRGSGFVSIVLGILLLFWVRG
jgi:uncharacterized protein YjeT (DUF2065 family)